jgi:segregation and condensation protein A
LDLLLQLIRREEMDITRVSLARVADQYLSYLDRIERASPGDLAEFLVIAAQLLLIKSQVLLPKPSVEEEEEEDVGSDLVDRLKLYKQFKAVAEQLRDREAQGLRSYAREVPAPKPDRHLVPGEGDLDRLLAMLSEVLAERREEPPVDEVVSRLTVTIDAKMAEIARLVTIHSQVAFRELLLACRSRQEIVVSFLAVLEMMKQVKLQVTQEGLFGPIIVAKHPDAGSLLEEGDVAAPP